MMNDPLPAPRPKTVLVVEDDVALRFVISEVLRNGGLTVAEAANGDEALALLYAGERIDLVFSDVHMPGKVDGLALAANVHSEFPDIPVLLTSGKHHPNSHIPFVAKPYAVADVLETVKVMLEGSDGE